MTHYSYELWVMLARLGALCSVVEWLWAVQDLNL